MNPKPTLESLQKDLNDLVKVVKEHEQNWDIAEKNFEQILEFIKNENQSSKELIRLLAKYEQR